MIRLFGPTVPDSIFVACSGGVDSMAALSFLANKSYRKVVLAFFHHGTEDSERALDFLTKNYPFDLDIAAIVISSLDTERPPRKSKEEHWRDERYKFFHSLNGPVVTAHHLDDCVETWMFGAMHGTPKTIPYSNGNVIRPFLTTPKSKLKAWCLKKGVPWLEDESNENVSYARNRIRHNILPEVYKVNPGLRKVVARKVQEEYHG